MKNKTEGVQTIVELISHDTMDTHILSEVFIKLKNKYIN